MEMNDFTVTLLGSVGTSLVGVIGILWYKIGKLDSEKDALREKFYEKYENLIVKQTELITTSTAQTNTFTNAIKEITQGMGNLQERISDSFDGLKDEIMRGKK